MEQLKTEAVIFIPGFYAGPRNKYLDDYLLLGLTTRLENRQVEVGGEEVKIQGHSGKRVIYDAPDEQNKTIDIYEVYWNDLINPLSAKSVKDQAFRGFFLFGYWLFSGIWRMSRKSRTLFLQFLLFMLLHVLWYYGTLIVILTTLGQNPSSFGLQVPAEWTPKLAEIGKSLGGWQIWIITSFILSLLPMPISSIVDLTDFTTRYLQDETQAGIGAVRDKIRQRVEKTLNDVIKQDEYERVTVLAHSFSVIIAIDLLADYQPRTKKPIRFISMGGAVEVLSYLSEWVIEESTKCLNNEAVLYWHDYYSDQDWLCTKTPVRENDQSSKFFSRKIRLRVPLAQQITGDSHNAYFFEKALLEDLLDG